MENTSNDTIAASEKPAKQEFTPEQIKKWDRDLRTLHAISNHYQGDGTINSHGIVVLKDGFATEAYCGGDMTRPHADMDIGIYSRSNQLLDREEEARVIQDILSNEANIAGEERTIWQRHELSAGKNTDRKIEFRETGKDGEFVTKRRLEIYLNNEMIDDPSTLQRRVLRDSQGKEYEFFVEDLHTLVATKIRIINERLLESEDRRRQRKRHTTNQDINEIKRLIALPEFQKTKVLELLAKRISKRLGIDYSQAIQQAEQQFFTALTLKIEE